MNEINETLLPKFNIEEQTTSPQLRSDKGITSSLQRWKGIADRGREGLIFGKKPVAELISDTRSFGILLAESLIRNQLDAAEAVGLCWIYEFEKLNNPVFVFFHTLKEQGRLDLMRPGIALLHDLCVAVWEKRLNDRPQQIIDMEESSSAEIFPDMMTVSQSKFDMIGWPNVDGGSSITLGAAAWWQIGKDFRDIVQHSTHERLMVITPLLSEITQTIPDARSWCLGVIFDLIGDENKNKNAILVPEWTTSIEPFMDRLTDSEAAWILTKVADTEQVVKKSIPPKNRPSFEKIISLLAERLISQHPQMSMADWINPPETFDNQLEINGNEMDRGRRKTMNPEPNTIKWAEKDGVPVLITRIKPLLLPEPTAAHLAYSYDRIAQWLGPDRGKEMSEKEHSGIERLLQLIVLKEVHASALHSAMDNWALHQISSGTVDTTETATLQKRKI